MKALKWTCMVLSLCLSPALLPAVELSLSPAQLKNMNVATAVVTSRKVYPRLRLSGNLMADQLKTYRVSTVMGGLVKDLKAVTHDRVSKGQLLARIHSPTLGQTEANYLETLALYNLAAKEKARIEGLWKEGVVAESRWFKVESEYERAAAAVLANRRLLTLAGLTDAQIKELPKNPKRVGVIEMLSPIDGQITSVEIESGELLSAGQTAFHVDDLSTLWAMVKIPVASLPQVEVGAEATIQVQANPGKYYQGKLKSLGGEVDMQSQTLAGRIVLNNPDGLLRPGMYADVALNGAAKEELMVPAKAVFQIGDQSYVFKVLGEGRFEPTAIKTGPEVEGWFAIHGGIKAKTLILSSGVAELKSHWQYQGGN